MSESSQTRFVVAISAPSGGGKTTLVEKLVEILDDATSLFFDDYDDTTVHPNDMHQWVKDGANYNEWKTPQLRQDLQALKTGKSIPSPTDGREIRAAKYVVFDDPLGRTHDEIAGLIDFMVYIDTPLDIAMARRILRDLDGQACGEVDKLLDYLKSELHSCLKGGRAAYLEMDKQIKPDCDLVLDGSLPVNELAKQVLIAVNQYF